MYNVTLTDQETVKEVIKDARRVNDCTTYALLSCYLGTEFVPHSRCKYEWPLRLDHRTTWRIHLTHNAATEELALNTSTQ
jgi:hypothetical protein